jgi:hypothetical protein
VARVDGAGNDGGSRRRRRAASPGAAGGSGWRCRSGRTRGCVGRCRCAGARGCSRRKTSRRTRGRRPVTRSGRGRPGSTSRLELRFAEGVVVADVRPAVAARDAEVDEQLRDRLGRHGRAAIGVQAVRGAVHLGGGSDEGLGDVGVLPGRHRPAETPETPRIRSGRCS